MGAALDAEFRKQTVKTMIAQKITKKLPRKGRVVNLSELLIQVDEQDNVIGSVERLKAHLGDGILHRGPVVVVKNQEGKVLLTQRSMNRPDLEFPPPFPGFWDVTIAGHPKWGQKDYAPQMIAELNEELGLEAKQMWNTYVNFSTTPQTQHTPTHKPLQHSR